MEVTLTRNRLNLLKALRQGPKSYEDTRAAANPSGANISRPKLTSLVHNPCIFAGWVKLEDDTYSITELGAEVLLRESTKLTAKKSNVVRANLFTPPKGDYMGEDLKRVAHRPGAFDYLQCPSIINGVSVPYTIK